MGDTMWVNGINLLEISDELKLHEMLDRSEEYEDRKIIRARLKEVIASNRAKREEMIRRREEEREEILRQRVRDAEEQKRRTLAMYDAMAKSAPAGGNKTMDVGILRGEGSGTSTPTSTHSAGPKVDLVEESIRQRQREADENKKKVLAAYDQAARSGPAGSARFIDFESVKPEDINTYESAPRYTSTFQMKGGIPVSFPAKFRPQVNPAKEQPHDSMEEAIRRRQRECDDRKRKTLDAYDKAQRSRPAGVPVSVYVPSTDGIEPVIELVGRPQRIVPQTPVTLPAQVSAAPEQYRQPPPPHHQQYRGPPLGGPPHVAPKPQAPVHGQIYQQQHHINLQQQQQQQYQQLPQQQYQQAQPQRPYNAYTPTNSYLNEDQNQYRNVANFRPIAPTPNAAVNAHPRTPVQQQQQSRQVTITSKQQQQPQQLKQQQQQQQQNRQVTITTKNVQQPQPHHQTSATLKLASNQPKTGGSQQSTTTTQSKTGGGTTTTTTTVTRKQYYEEEDDEEEEEESDEEEEEEEEE